MFGHRIACCLRPLLLLPLLGMAAPPALAQDDRGPLVFQHLIGRWQVEITGLGPDGGQATRRGEETCRWTAGRNGVLCEARFEVFGIPLEETSLFSLQAATGEITRTMINSRGLGITARCRSPQPNQLLCAAEVPTGDPKRTTHLRDVTRLGQTRQTSDWEASRDRQKTWQAVGTSLKTRLAD